VQLALLEVAVSDNLEVRDAIQTNLVFFQATQPEILLDTQARQTPSCHTTV
jgi:hypothetical protein